MRKADSKKKGAVRRRTLSPQRPGHAQTSGLPKPAGRKDPNPASKVSRPASAKHDGLAHKSIARTLNERKTKSPPGKKGGKGAGQPPPQKPAVSPTLTSQEVPTQDVTKLLAGGGAPTSTPTQQEPLISGIDPPTTPPRESVANADNKLSTGFTPKTPEQTLNEDACDVSLSPIGSPFASPMQPAPLLNSKGNLATPKFSNEDSNPMETMKFRENKTIAKWRNHSASKSCSSRELLTSHSCLLTLFAKIDLSRKYLNLQK